MVKDPKNRATLDEIKEHPLLQAPIKDAMFLLSIEEGDRSSIEPSSPNFGIARSEEFNWDKEMPQHDLQRGSSNSQFHFDFDQLANKMKDKVHGVPGIHLHEFDIV